MFPALRKGQDVLSFNWFYKPNIGDMVIIKQGNREIVKRVKYVDGDKVYVTGDNADESTDSRHFGPISLDQIVGKVIFALEDHPERSGDSRRVEGSNMIPCSQCEFPVIGIYGRKDAICNNCGFKLACCGE